MDLLEKQKDCLVALKGREDERLGILGANNTLYIQ